MATVILVAAVILAAAACPTVAWIQRRRGGRGCCQPARPLDRADDRGDLTTLRAKRAQIDERIVVLESEHAGSSARGETSAGIPRPEQRGGEPKSAA